MNTGLDFCCVWQLHPYDTSHRHEKAWQNEIIFVSVCVCHRVNTWVSNLAALYKKDLHMSCMPSVSQVEFSRHANAPQPTWRALLRQRATSAVGRENRASAGVPNIGFTGNHCTLTEPSTWGQLGVRQKMWGTKENFHTLAIHKRHSVQSLGANSDSTGDWAPYSSEGLKYCLALVHFSWPSLFSRAWMNNTKNTKQFPTKLLACLETHAHKHTLAPLAHMHANARCHRTVFNYFAQALIVKLSSSPLV